MNKTFAEAFENSEEVQVNDNLFLKWNVLSIKDLIISKIKANRPKDLLDFKQLREINNNQ